MKKVALSAFDTKRWLLDGGKTKIKFSLCSEATIVSTLCWHDLHDSVYICS